MVIKILLLVAIAAFAGAVSGRTLPVGKSAADVQTAFFHFHFPPYGIPFGGFSGGVGSGFGGAGGVGYGGRPVGGGLGAGGFGSGDGSGFDGGDGTGATGSLKDGGTAGVGAGNGVGGGALGDGDEGGLIP